jgi:hypothetical protein
VGRVWLWQPLRNEELPQPQLPRRPKRVAEQLYRVELTDSFIARLESSLGVVA